MEKAFWKWPENSSLNYNAILQLVLLCCNVEEWTEVPYVQAIMLLGFPWWSRDQDSKLSLLRGQVWSLTGKLKSHRSLWQTKRGERVSWSFTKTLLCLAPVIKKPRESVNTSDVLDDALPTFPNSQVGKKQAPSTSQNQLLLWGLLTNPKLSLLVFLYIPRYLRRQRLVPPG